MFDAPSLNRSFEDRIEFMKEYKEKIKDKPGSQFIRFVEFEKCEGMEHLKRRQKEVEDQGGEGVMLRRPLSLYEQKRSDTLLKVKSFQDTEAEVVDHEPGLGKYTGMLGALIVRMKNGVQFSIGTGYADYRRFLWREKALHFAMLFSPQKSPVIC